MNDKAEEELQKYKKLIEERMQSMVGGSPQVVKPVTPPPQKEEPKEKPKPEETTPPETKVEVSRPTETRPPETTVPDTRVAESRPSGVETPMGKSLLGRPVPPAPEEYRPYAVEPRTPVLETKPVEKRPVEPPKPTTEVKSAPEVEAEYKSPYIKVDRKDPAYKNLFKPFKKMGSTLFKSPLKKTSEKWRQSYVGKLVKGILYYIVTIQIWLCIVAFLGMYFFKTKRE
jgi:hypothetical protein